MRVAKQLSASSNGLSFTGYPKFYITFPFCYCVHQVSSKDSVTVHFKIEILRYDAHFQ